MTLFLGLILLVQNQFRIKALSYQNILPILDRSPVDDQL